MVAKSPRKGGRNLTMKKYRFDRGPSALRQAQDGGLRMRSGRDEGRFGTIVRSTK